MLRECSLELRTKCTCPKPCSARHVVDLKQRGLLDSTLIWWGGEFGRTVTKDRNGGGTPGRDHWGNAFFCLLGGGGLKGGRVVGSSERASTQTSRTIMMSLPIALCI